MSEGRLMTNSSPTDAHHNDSAPGGKAALGPHDVARVGYGAMQLPRLKDPTAARTVLRRALDLGINHFDTAYFYGNGVANRALAEEVAGRDGVVIVTKVGARPPERGPMPLVPAQRPEELRRAVQDNLDSLGVERLDVVNLRRVGPENTPLPGLPRVNLEDQLAEMVAMRDEGLIGQIGVSNVNDDQLRRSLPVRPVCVQNAYSLTSRTHEAALALSRSKNMAWVPYFPLGGAFPGSAKVWREPEVQEIARELDVAPAQVGLAWLLHHSDHTLLIPGTASLEHLEQNVDAGRIRLDEPTMARLDALRPTTGARGLLSRARERVTSKASKTERRG
jgi:pyridoxine 4-dehydrogenase